MNIMLPQKFKVKNCRHFWKEKEKFYLNWAGLHYLDTMWVEKFLRNGSLCVFAFLAKIRKFKTAAIFEQFLKRCHIYFLNTLGVENFDEIALSLTVKEIEAFLCFRIFGENSKWPPFLKFFGKVVIYTS